MTVESLVLQFHIAPLKLKNSEDQGTNTIFKFLGFFLFIRSCLLLLYVMGGHLRRVKKPSLKTVISRNIEV